MNGFGGWGPAEVNFSMATTLPNSVNPSTNISKFECKSGRDIKRRDRKRLHGGCHDLDRLLRSLGRTDVVDAHGALTVCCLLLKYMMLFHQTEVRIHDAHV